jgi:hypothetical protein
MFRQRSSTPKSCCPIPGSLTVVLSSASSKTAIGTAELLAEEPGIRTHGLTSPANIAFTAGLGVYDQVSAYDDLGSLATDGPAVFLDFTRNPDVVTSVHHLLGNRLRRTVLTGGTHSVQPLELPGLPEPERFFAPAEQALQRTKVGDLAYEQRLAAGEQQFLRRAAVAAGRRAGRSCSAAGRVPGAARGAAGTRRRHRRQATAEGGTPRPA